MMCHPKAKQLEAAPLGLLEGPPDQLVGRRPPRLVQSPPRQSPATQRKRTSQTHPPLKWPKASGATPQARGLALRGGHPGAPAVRPGAPAVHLVAHPPRPLRRPARQPLAALPPGRGAQAPPLHRKEGPRNPPPPAAMPASVAPPLPCLAWRQAQARPQLQAAGVRQWTTTWLR